MLVGDKILVQPLPDKPEEKLAELTKGIEFGRKTRRKASEFLLSQAKHQNLFSFSVDLFHDSG